MSHPEQETASKDLAEALPACQGESVYQTCATGAPVERSGEEVEYIPHLHLPQPEKGTIGGKALRRRLSLWQRALLRTCVANKAQERGMQVANVDPRYTSKNCSRCGLRGVRRRHAFSCPHCGYRQHADINAAFNIRNRFTILRDSGFPSMSPEAQVQAVGKPLDVSKG